VEYLVIKAFDIATFAYNGLVDKSGVDYIYHPLSVARKVSSLGDEYEATALLHDAIEDSELDAEELINMGMPGVVVNAVVILTKKPGVSYLDFVRSIKDSGNVMAIKVKLADLEDNMDSSRGYKMPESMAKRYAKAVEILKE